MDCVAMTTASGCMVDTSTNTSTPVVIHYEYGKDASGAVILYKTRYTNAAGTPISLTGTQSVTPGACVQVTTDVEWEMLCDDDGNAATTNTAFLRKYTTTRNASTGAVITEVVADYALDMTTSYTVVGTAASCSSTQDYETNDLILCDGTGTSFIRRVSYLNGTQVSVGDFQMDGTTAYTVSGTVAACPTCAAKTAQGVVTSWG